MKAVESIMAESDDGSNAVVTKSMTTKVNENLFADIRMINPTPDTLQFCQLFPGVVENLLLQMSDLPFIYERQVRTFYEKLDGSKLKVADLPKIPKAEKKPLSPEERVIMNDYHKMYVERVRQQNVRSQTTKDKFGTLPLYAYQKPPSAPLNRWTLSSCFQQQMKKQEKSCITKVRQ